jgi:hypothetical protein
MPDYPFGSVGVMPAALLFIIMCYDAPQQIPPVVLLSDIIGNASANSFANSFAKQVADRIAKIPAMPFPQPVALHRRVARGMIHPIILMTSHSKENA